MPEDPTESKKSAPSPFSLASSNPFAGASPFSFGSAPPAIGTTPITWAVPPEPSAPQKGPEVVLKVKCPQFSQPTGELSIQMPLHSTVGAIVARLRKEMGEAEAPITLLCAGKVLSCMTQQLADVVFAPSAESEGGAMRTIAITCLKKWTEATTTGMAAPSLTPAAMAAMAAAKRAAAAESAAASAVSTADVGPSADETLRVKPAGFRPPLTVPFSEGLTALGLKQELVRRGEGSAVEQFSLRAAGKELMDQIPLHQQKVRRGDTLELQLKAVPFKTPAPSKSTCLTSFGGCAARRPPTAACTGPAARRRGGPARHDCTRALEPLSPTPPPC